MYGRSLRCNLNSSTRTQACLHEWRCLGQQLRQGVCYSIKPHSRFRVLRVSGLKVQGVGFSSLHTHIYIYRHLVRSEHTSASILSVIECHIVLYCSRTTYNMWQRWQGLLLGRYWQGSAMTEHMSRVVCFPSCRPPQLHSTAWLYKGSYRVTIRLL